MYCSSTEPFPETRELTKWTFHHSAVPLSRPVHVFSAPRKLSYFVFVIVFFTALARKTSYTGSSHPFLHKQRAGRHDALDRPLCPGERDRERERERSHFGSSLSPLWEPGCHPGDLVGGLRPPAATLGLSEALQGRFPKVPPCNWYLGVLALVGDRLFPGSPW